MLPNGSGSKQVNFFQLVRFVGYIFASSCQSESRQLFFGQTRASVAADRLEETILMLKIKYLSYVKRYRLHKDR